MLAKHIEPDSILTLKRDNPYGFEGNQLHRRVAGLKFRDGYSTPWIIDTTGGAFRPSDFERRNIELERAEMIAEANANVASLGRKKNYS